MRLREKVAIITGAGSGIGRASAQLFAEEGATVVVADYDEAGGRETADLIGKHALFVKVDVTKEDDVAGLVGETVERFGQIDILFNNAGINLPPGSTVVNTTEADWDRVIAVNLKGVFLGAKHTLPVMMAQRRGAIINTASTAGIGAGRGLAAYCASKAGVVSLTRQLAVDYAAYNIRVNCICPGALPIPLARVYAFFQQTPGALEERNERLRRQIPLGRLCSASDVAYAALYLASEESTFITGTALVVDGGSSVV